MAAMADGPLVDSISLGGRRDDLIGYAKPLSMIGDVACTKPKDEHDYKELIRECFTPMIRDFPGAGYPGPGDFLTLQDGYSIEVDFEGRDGTLKVLGRGLLFLRADDGRTFFFPRGEIEFLRYKWHRLMGPGIYAALVVTVKNSPYERAFWRIHRNEMPRLSNVIRGKGWNIADLEEYDGDGEWFPAYGCRPASESGHGMKRKRKESPSVAAPMPMAMAVPASLQEETLRLLEKALFDEPASLEEERIVSEKYPPPPPRKKRRRLVKKYLFDAPPPPKKRRRLVKKYL